MFYDLTLPDMQTEAQGPSDLRVKVTTRRKSCPQNMQQVTTQTLSSEKDRYFTSYSKKQFIQYPI